mgnify:FL=1
MTTVAVLGGGSFGTAMANMIAANGHAVTLWMRDAEAAATTTASRRNSRYLPDYALEESLQISADLATAVNSAEVVFFAVPSKSLRQLASDVAPLLADRAGLVSMAKGVEADSFLLPSQIIEQELPNHNIAVISGPNLAAEICQRQITATVVASDSAPLCAQVQELIASDYFRVYANSDRFGVELAGALKNIYAIVAGVVAAMGMGQNSRAVMLTRSLAEMSRFAVQLGADPMTFLGLSGVGDLYVTCSSPLSRNYQVGFELGNGKGLDEAIAAVGQTAEGVNTTRLVVAKAAELGVYMPLANALAAILFEQRSIGSLLRDMMSAEQGHDVEFATPR